MNTQLNSRIKEPFKALVVDDEEDILELIQYNLEKEGYLVKTATSGKQAVELARSFRPDLVLLDIMMPEQDGVETCRQLREIPELHNPHIIFLTARTEEYSEVAAFHAGADDYIGKPIRPRALTSRINALFRRQSRQKEESSDISAGGGGLVIDKSAYVVTLDGKRIDFPRKEFELLYFLAQNPNRVFSRDELLSKIWGSDVYVFPRTVDVHIRKIREKIGEGYIITIKGIGYKFQAD